MAKGNAKRINKDAEAEASRINRDSGQFGDLLSGRLGGAQDRSNTAYNDAYKGYSGFLGDDYGGGGPDFSQYESMFKKLYDTGGLSDENIQRIRGNGGYDEFARTGGYSTGDLANIRSRSNRTIPSFFDALRARMNDQNAISGTPSNYSASIQAMARDQARGAADTALDTELGIKERVNEGRKYGISGMSDAERFLSQLLSQNKIAGAEGGLRAAGMGGEYGLNKDRNRLAALEGIRGLRTDVPGEEFNLYKMMLENMGQRGGLYGQNLGNRMQYNPNKSFMDYLSQFTGAAAPFVSPFLMPGGGGGSSRLPNPGFRPVPSGPYGG